MTSILVVYWSGTGNTELMAEKICEGIRSEGVLADLKSVEQVKYDELEQYEKIAFGCSSMGIEELEEEEFEPFFKSVEPLLRDKKILLFGSYGWGEGEWMDEWLERSKQLGAFVFNNQGLIINSTPDEDGENECFNFGKNFVAF